MKTANQVKVRRRAPRRQRADANKGGRPRLGKSKFKLTIRPDILAAIRKLASAHYSDVSQFIENVLRTALRLNVAEFEVASATEEGAK